MLLPYLAIMALQKYMIGQKDALAYIFSGALSVSDPLKKYHK